MTLASIAVPSDYPESIRIAVTTNDLVLVNASFASAKQIVIYEVTGSDSTFVDCHQFRPGGGGGGKGKKEDGSCWMLEADADVKTINLNDAKLAAIEGCAMIFSLGLSDVHAVNIRNKGMFPVKMENPREIPQVIDYVQKMINQPQRPLWMRRALTGRMGKMDYADQDA